jgi:hypothetical protein
MAFLGKTINWATTLSQNVVVTSPVDTTGANFIALFVTYAAGTPSVSDSYGNTWTYILDQGSAGNKNFLWVCYNPTAGPGHTFTATITPGSPLCPVLTAAYFDDVISGVDQTAKLVDAFGTTLDPGPITPTANGELILSMCGTNSGCDGMGITSPFTLLYAHDEMGSFYPGSATAYYYQPTAGALTAHWSGTGSGTTLSGWIVSFSTGSAPRINTIISSGLANGRQYGAVPDYAALAVISSGAFNLLALVNDIAGDVKALCALLLNNGSPIVTANGPLFELGVTDYATQFLGMRGLLRSIGLMPGVRTITDNWTLDSGSAPDFTILMNSGSALTLTLPDSTSTLALSNFYQRLVFVKNENSGVGTITPSSGTIEGASSITLTQGQGAIIHACPAEWKVMASFGGINIGPNNVGNILSADPASPADDTWWVVRTGTSPNATLALKGRVAGATKTIASETI